VWSRATELGLAVALLAAGCGDDKSGGGTSSGADETSATAPTTGEMFGCRWLVGSTVEVAEGICTVTASSPRCFEVELVAGGPGCEGYFGVLADGTELVVPTDCERPVGDYEPCFPDFDATLAHPACACIAIDYCASQDEATCAAASNELRACMWDGFACS
jgi:hypothetical protein